MEQRDEETRAGRSAWRVAAPPLALIGAAALFFYVAHRYGIGVETMTGWVRAVSDRWWAPVAFIVIYAVATTFFFPATMLIVSAGVIWGWFLGGVWALVAGVVASSITYFAGRMEAGDFADILRERAARVHDILERDGFVALLVLRFVPAAPFAVVNYAAGIAGIGIRDYFLATLLGMLPGSFIFCYFSSAVAAGIVTPRAAAGRIALAGVLLAALTIAGRIVGRKFRAAKSS
jgi:Uncharacterized conserved protein